MLKKEGNLHEFVCRGGRKGKVEEEGVCATGDGGRVCCGVGRGRGV